MAGPEFQPPPTWANPMLENTDPTTGEKKTTFNPVWLKWFVDLTAVISNSGGGSGTVGGNTNGPPPALHLTGRVAIFANDLGNALADGGPLWEFVDREVLSGACDGVNMQFITVRVPKPPESLFLYHKLNGLMYVLNVDYVFDNDHRVTMTAPPAVGDEIYANYRTFTYY